ncbi:MAG: twin-arginine translocation pathway signal, partial [Bacteroidia bacterium]|nr:twin-arginine translocation pathway signal [Bacteroidia bacterium]
MEKITRRKFIELGSIASASCWLPRFLVPVSAAGVPDDRPRILVVVQLSGGNDGLNTVIPYTNDLYYRHRPGLALDAMEVIRLNDETGLHPALEALRPVFDDGELCIVNGVGYPNPDRSHFRSMDIWQSGSGSMEIVQTGWLGRYLDHTCKGGELPHHALELDDSLSLALKGEEVNGLSLRNPDRMKKALSGSMMEGLSRMYHDGHGDGEVRYLYKILAEAEQSVDYLYRQSKVYK